MHIPVSTAILASSMWQRMWVRILALRPSLQIASQSARDCSDAAGDVSSRYSTPKASSALAIAILVLVSKKALANCSPSVRAYIQRADPRNHMAVCSPRSVDSMILKFETLFKKSDARGAYGLRFCCWDGPALTLFSIPTMSALAEGSWSPF